MREAERSADLDVRSLRYLQMLAEHRSFTAAAAALGISQPALSQAVARLERMVGGRLVVRDARGVAWTGPALTPAGRALTADAADVAQTLERALRRARQLAQTEQRDHLVVGLSSGTPRWVSTSLAQAIEELQVPADRHLAPPAVIQILAQDLAGDLVQHRALDVTVRSVAWGREVSALLSGTVDVTVVHLSARARHDVTTGGAVNRRVRVVELGKVGRVVVLRAGHRLARRASVQVDDLEGEPIVRARTGGQADHGRGDHRGVDHGQDGPVHRAWMLDPRPAGVGPHLAGPAVGAVEELLAVVAAGQGVAIAPADLLDVRSGAEDLVFVPLRDVELVQLCALVRDPRATA